LAAAVAGTLAFRVPAQDACRVRRALTASPGCCIRSCVPHPRDREVALWIEYPAGAQHTLMGLLMACVPCGQFGRCAPGAGVAH
jgi:hypothetical protein